jgi:hypothetical protein
MARMPMTATSPRHSHWSIWLSTPNKGSLNVDFKDPFSQGYSAFIYDCLGRKVVESPITQPKSILNLDGLSTGWYQLTIVNNQFEIVYRKSIYKD